MGPRLRKASRRHDAFMTKGALPATEHMLELNRISSSSRLLDIATGTGEPSVAAAKTVGVTGQTIDSEYLCHKGYGVQENCSR